MISVGDFRFRFHIFAFFSTKIFVLLFSSAFARKLYRTSRERVHGTRREGKRFALFFYFFWLVINCLFKLDFCLFSLVGNGYFLFYAARLIAQRNICLNNNKMIFQHWTTIHYWLFFLLYTIILRLFLKCFFSFLYSIWQIVNICICIIFSLLGNMPKI